MKFSRQTLLGMGVFFGGGILLFAILQQVLTNKPAEEQAITTNVELVPVPSPPVLTLPPENAVVEMPPSVETQTAATDVEQQPILPVTQPEPLSQTDHMAEIITANEQTTKIEEPVVIQRTPVEPIKPVVKPTAVKKPTETVKQEKPKADKKPKSSGNQTSSYQVQAGDGLISLSRKFDVPVSVLAMVNGLDNHDKLYIGQTLNIPTTKQIKKIENEILQRQKRTTTQTTQQQKPVTNSQFEQAKQQLKDARKQVKETDAKGTFGVQIALANDQEGADKVVKQLKAAGYRVRTTETTRGIRIVVGPEKGKVAALALRNKINKDPRLNVQEAWVLYW